MNTRWLRHAALAALLGASTVSYVCTSAEAADPTVPVRVVTQVKGGVLEISVTWANEASPIFKSEYSSGAARITIDGASLKGSTQVIPLEGNNAKEALISQVDDETVVVNIRAENEPHIKVFQIPTVKNVKGVKYVLPINLLSTKPTVAPKADNKKPAVAPKADDKKPTVAPKADDKKPTVAPKADDKKPTVAPKADNKKPAVAPKAEDKKPAVAPKADDKKPAAAPKADDKKPAVAPKVDDKKPAVAPKADDKKPAVAPKADDKEPAVAPKAEDKKPAAIPIETSVTEENATVVKDHYAYFPLKERSAATVAASLIKLYPNVDFKVDEMLNVIFIQGSAEDVAKIGNVLKVVSNFEK